MVNFSLTVNIHNIIKYKAGCCALEEKKCDFVVYTFKDFKTVRVVYDRQFVQGITEQLKSFYDEYFRDAVVSTHFYKNYYQYFASKNTHETVTTVSNYSHYRCLFILCSFWHNAVPKITEIETESDGNDLS